VKPLNYAILKHFTKVKEACAEDVIEALKGEYGSFKALNRNDVLNALMTAEANGLLEETRFELDQTGNLRIYYRAHEEGAATINKYIKD
jgi:DNA-binding PadR family transcriptional regulator